jgi:glyoxylase-like metal-dependent hydrolase (beta-lactamase superfamily II)
MILRGYRTPLTRWRRPLPMNSTPSSTPKAIQPVDALRPGKIGIVLRLHRPQDRRQFRRTTDCAGLVSGSDATSQVVEISKFDGNYIGFEGSTIKVIKDIQGDTDQNTMLWIPGQSILIAGDVLFNDIHVYTAETDGKARAKWLDTLSKVRELKPSVVVPGHSKAGAALDGSTAVDFTERYLRAFEEELKTAKDPQGLINAMKEKFPSAGLLLALERGATANVESRQTN